MNRGIILGLALVTLSSAAMAQISISAGTYMPKDATIKSIFGSSSFAWGIGLGKADRTNRAGFGFDVAGIGMTATNNRFFSLGATYGYEVQSGSKSETMTYARVGTGIAYYDYDMNIGLNNFKDQTFKPMTVAEAGVVLGKHFTVNAQYLFMPKLKGLDFSGARIQAMYTFGG